MPIPRRFLPSTSLLQAFETAARTQNVTTAAKELSLTQSAVSRQIRALEEQLGTELFHREKQSIRLTAGGERYAREIREALQKISSASMNLRANPSGGTLALAILPTFGTRWLAPRLPDFLQKNPGITINLTTKLEPFDFTQVPLDAAIHFGRADWPQCAALPLCKEDVVPACAPALLEQFGFKEVADLVQAPLLHLTSRPDAWEKFMARHDVETEPLHGMLFDQFATAAQAAMVGLGVALLPEFLIQNELEAGALVRALPHKMRSDEMYYLCWPHVNADYPPLVAFRKWLSSVT
ncbi:LysR family transcriptional regulator [Donghicola mangrovi]|uniref:LysR family transcriptional regulator n=1 Tax=Donghicola mangrovi TaxID=2729614 RepID=A0A850Q984_9RHOB|nr:LysR family transcriptional regulator [Donghicola mangrovi]NVO25503.1 LysR family transcriptional regulator [Donghicola mangrovi]